MSRYLVNKLMWEVDMSEDALAAFKQDAGAFLAGWPQSGQLSPGEREAVEGRDYGVLYAMGVNPFLLWQFARSVSVPDEMGIEELISSFRESVEPYGYPDFFT